MKNKEQQAYAHSRKEAIQCNVQVSDKTKDKKNEAKWKIKNTADNAETRAKRLKEGRDDRRAPVAISVQKASYSKLISKHDETKAKLLLLTDLNFSSGSNS